VRHFVLVGRGGEEDGVAAVSAPRQKSAHPTARREPEGKHDAEGGGGASAASSATVLSSADDPSDGLLRGSSDADGLPVEPDVLAAHGRPCAR
jgi:hypothetical protein